MAQRKTALGIQGGDFAINGRLTYAGRRYRGMRIEGLLLNSRMVQGIFDDRNAATRPQWRYPDGPWDAERNTREFIQAMPQWRARGLNALTLNLQGGSPYGYSREQPWINSAFDGQGTLDAAYLRRLAALLDAADEQGLIVILGLFYFGQFDLFASDRAIWQAVDNIVDWLLAQRYAHVLIEVGNEVDITRKPYGYGASVVAVERCHEVMRRIQARTQGQVDAPAGRLLVSTSLKGNSIPPSDILRVADFILLHGNGVEDPARIGAMVRACRGHASFQGQPILFNEDDHYAFDAPRNNMMAALSEHAGWGFFDYRRAGEGYAEGFQSVPVDWTISSARKKAFFDLVTDVTGHKP